METVQLQCGNCKQLMAIGVEHMGGQVRCPHCQAVVQTPPHAPNPAPAPPAAIPNADVNQRESIFAGPEPSESVLGEADAPKVEPPQSAPEAPAAAASPPSTTPEAGANPEFAAFKTKPIYTSGVLSLIALIFLVPYAVVMTAFVIYLLFNQGARHDPYEFLRDPVPGKEKGGPKTVTFKQPVHSLPLAAHLKTKLRKPIQIGNLLVTFEKVRATEDGDLRLILRAKNVSTNTAFEPINGAFVKPGGELYSYLEAKTGGTERIYGADLEYHKDMLVQDDPPAGYKPLNPNGETVIALTTDFQQRAKVAKVVQDPDTHTWRVQVRRGFVKVNGKNVSATAVIGVEFTSAEIEH